MAVSFINMVVFLIIRYKTKRLSHFFTAMMWLNCALWGMTVNAMNVPWVRILNITIILCAATFGIISGVMKLNEAIHDKHI